MEKTINGIRTFVHSLGKVRVIQYSGKTMLPAADIAALLNEGSRNRINTLVAAARRYCAPKDRVVMDNETARVMRLGTKTLLTLTGAREMLKVSPATPGRTKKVTEWMESEVFPALQDEEPAAPQEAAVPAIGDDSRVQHLYTGETFCVDGVECYEADGTAYLKLEAVARGLGFVQKKDGQDYVRWERVEKLLAELGYGSQWDRDSFVPENIVYRLAMKAKNAVAEAFQTKVADEIIPAIRRHGAYITPETLEKIISSPDFGITLLTALKAEQEKRKALEDKIREDKPAVEFARSVGETDDTIPVGEFAKLLRQNGIPMGQVRLFAWLRDNGFLIARAGDTHNQPTQDAIARGLFRIAEATDVRNGKTRLIRTPRMTGKGQRYFFDRIRNEMTV